MKAIIKLPALFLFMFIIVLAVFTAFQLLAIAVADYPNFRDLKPVLFFINLPLALFNVLPGTLVLSLLIILMNIALKPAPPFLATLMLFIAACAVFIGCLIVVAGLVPAQTKGAMLTHSFAADTINRVENVLIFPERTDADMLYNNLVFDPAQSGFKFSYHQSIKPVIKDNMVTVGISGISASKTLKDPYTHFIYEYDPLPGDILSAYGGFNSDLQQYARARGTMFYLFCITFIFFIMACGMFTRITRWPLFNIMFFTAIITSVMMLYGFYKAVVYPELANMMQNKALLEALPLLVLLGMGILFILVDVVFIPRKYWKEGINID